MYDDFDPYYDDEEDDLRREFAKPKFSGCNDHMCGAEDCTTCHPEFSGYEEDED